MENIKNFLKNVRTSNYKEADKFLKTIVLDKLKNRAERAEEIALGQTTNTNEIGDSNE